MAALPLMTHSHSHFRPFTSLFLCIPTLSCCIARWKPHPSFFSFSSTSPAKIFLKQACDHWCWPCHWSDANPYSSYIRPPFISPPISVALPHVSPPYCLTNVWGYTPSLWLVLLPKPSLSFVDSISGSILSNNPTDTPAFYGILAQISPLASLLIYLFFSAS